MKLAPLLAATLLAGCSTAMHPVSTAGNAASGAVTLAGKAATSATGTAVRVAQTGVTVTGKVVGATTSAVAKVAKAPFVIIKDKLSGRTKKIPWEKGLTVARAGVSAGLKPPAAALFQVVRGQEILKGNPQLPLQPGDVVEWFGSVAGAGRL